MEILKAMHCSIPEGAGEENPSGDGGGKVVGVPAQQLSVAVQRENAASLFGSSAANNYY